jgi:hypothetical protein
LKESDSIDASALKQDMKLELHRLHDPAVGLVLVLPFQMS